jgi:Mn2+/Fe2+ NRAMP family transporter
LGAVRAMDEAAERHIELVNAEPFTEPPTGGFWSYVTSMGPGIVVALSWVGTGDVVDDSVAGGNYGYALLWALPLSLVLRFVFVNTLAKYPLYNIPRDRGIVQGLSRVHPAFRVAMLVSFMIYAHILAAFTLSGVGSAVHGLVGRGSQFWWAVLGAVSVVVVTRRGAYRLLERLFKIILAVMVAAFAVGLVLVGVHWDQLLSGLAFDFPEQQGLFDSGLVVSSLLLATIGSMANLFYPEFLRSKGWTTPRHRRVQTYDLAFGTVAVFVLGACVWAIGAEVLHGSGRTVDDAADIAAGLSGAIGPIGEHLFYIGLLGAAWTTVAGSTFALAKMTTEALHEVAPARAEKYGGVSERDPVYRVVVGWTLVAVVWSLPFAPDFVVLTVVAHTLTSPFLVLIVIGLIVLLNRRDLMGDRRNRWWENVVLGLIGVLVTISAAQGLTGVWDVLT